MTAPVAGLYVIGFHQLNDVAAYTEVHVRVNGTVLNRQTYNTESAPVWQCLIVHR